MGVEVTILMDRSELFRDFIAFTASVLETKHDFTKDIRIEGITPVQYGILEYLFAHRDEPVTISEMSDCQHMSLPNTSRELRKLGEKGLCEKFSDSEDKRKQYIRLSPEGQARMAEAFRKVEARFLERIRGISDEELGELARAIRLLDGKVF